MRLINQSCTAFVQEPGLEGIYKQIERAGRTCYKSTDKITAESAKPFVDRMIKSNHTAMLEHGTVYLKLPAQGILNQIKEHNNLDYRNNKYSKVNTVMLDFNDSYPIKEGNGTFPGCLWDMVTTNLRVIAENGWWDDLKYICEPTEHHIKRYTLSCTTALHCYKDLTRHRVFSFAIESTRYCNYTKDKFGSELTFITPTWVELPEGSYYSDGKITPLAREKVDPFTLEGAFINNLIRCEDTYNVLIKEGWQAQQAAEVLPQCIKGDMIITGFEDDWKHLLDLRYYGTTGTPHPMVKELATLMKEELEKLGFNYEN